MPEYNIRTYGTVEFRVSARTKKAAIKKLHNMFHRDNPIDPLSGRIITENVTCHGHAILWPKLTEEFKFHEDDPG